MLYQSIEENIKINGKDVNKLIIAGPCSVESEEQIIRLAKKLKDIGVDVLRGGCFKPRTSPYSFQGLGDEGIKYLVEASKITGLPIITEIMDIEQLNKYKDVIDIIQIGSRNMYNYELLKEVGKLNKPVLLKRGMSATYDEWLNAAEYILQGGNKNVILCERGIRGFDNATRNVLDIQAVSYIKHNTKLPIIVDPSHAAGNNYMIEDMSKASIAAGSDGIMVEVSDDIEACKCDKNQAITVEQLKNIINYIK